MNLEGNSVEGWSMQKQGKTWESDLLTWNDYCSVWRKQSTILVLPAPINITFNRVNHANWTVKKKCIIEFSNTQVTIIILPTQTLQKSQTTNISKGFLILPSLLHPSNDQHTYTDTTKNTVMTHECLCLATNHTCPWLL